MAPKATGIKFQEHCRSMELVETALSLSRAWLRPGGTFLAKVFIGEQELVRTLTPLFSQVRWVKPEASRQESTEKYLLASGYAPTGTPK